jgi:hypothetical protein
MVGGIVGGFWLDRWLGLLPLFTLLGVVLGGVVAVYGVYRMVQPLLRDETTPPEGGRKRSGG